jgi:RecA/RadA recombinase
LRLSEFVFKGGARCVSLYGLEGKGKSAIALQVAKDFDLAVYIATEGQMEPRITSLGMGERLIYVTTPTKEALLVALAGLAKLPRKPDLVILDSANAIYRQTWNLKDLAWNMAFLADLSYHGVKVLTVWEMSANNRVAGEKVMRAYCDRVLRATGSFLLGKNEYCKYKVTKEEVLGCL